MDLLPAFRKPIGLLSNSQIQIGVYLLEPNTYPLCTEQKRPTPWPELPEQLALRLSVYIPSEEQLGSSSSASDRARSQLYVGGGSVTVRQISLDGTLSRKKYFLVSLLF